MSNTSITVITALLSGVIATIITISWQKAYEKRKAKLDIFKVLMSKRYSLSAVESVDALNMIDGVFYQSPKVRKAWKEFLEASNVEGEQKRLSLLVDKHLKLLEEIAKDVGYRKIEWGDIKNYYCPIGLSNRLRDEAVLCRVQIDAGIAQINKSKAEAESAQTPKSAELATQTILEVMKNPEGLSKLVDLAAKFEQK